MTDGSPKKNDPQLTRFLETARALGCDEDKDRFEAQLGKIAAHKPSKDEAKPKPTKSAREKKPKLKPE
jgi:hypothetical protein